MEVAYHVDADATLTRLERDPSQERLLESVNAALDLIATEPGSREARARRTGSDPNLWLISVRAGDEDWVVAWFQQEEEGHDVAVIRYIGVDPF